MMDKAVCLPKEDDVMQSTTDQPTPTTVTDQTMTGTPDITDSSRTITAINGVIEDWSPYLTNTMHAVVPDERDYYVCSTITGRTLAASKVVDAHVNQEKGSYAWTNPNVEFHTTDEFPADDVSK